MLEPKHKFASVLRELSDGLADGAIKLTRQPELANSHREREFRPTSISSPGPRTTVDAQVACGASDTVSDPAAIGSTTAIHGQIVIKQDLYIDGQVEGTIESLDNLITIGPNGYVLANIRAHRVIVLGQFLGNIEALERVEIRKDAVVVGEITTWRISVEDGALFNGSIDIRRMSPVSPAEGELTDRGGRLKESFAEDHVVATRATL